ncbi:hypothetical protein DL93DRAFT_969588 [Clavulina sp. PMI_390]|nr:hypothetical protein DL93DRAFT_969588 [Clavulina sp. PMI_390]
MIFPSLIPKGIHPPLLSTSSFVTGGRRAYSLVIHTDDMGSIYREFVVIARAMESLGRKSQLDTPVDDATYELLRDQAVRQDNGTSRSITISPPISIFPVPTSYSNGTGALNCCRMCLMAPIHAQMP